MERSQGRRWAPLSCRTDEEEGIRDTPRRGRYGRKEKRRGGGREGIDRVRQCKDKHGERDEKESVEEGGETQTLTG